NMLIQIVACYNLGLGKAFLVQHFSRDVAEVGQIARIDPDAFQLLPFLPKFFPYLDRVLDPVDGIVSIHQEDAIIGKGICLGLKCLQFRIKRHDPAVGGGTTPGNIKKLTRHDIAGRDTSPYIRSAGSCYSTVYSLCPPQPKLHHRIALSSQGDSCCLSSHKRLEIDQVKQRGFEQLTLYQRTFDPEQWHVWKNDFPFFHGIYVASEAESLQIVDKVLFKHCTSIRVF